jgi:hypothetical protein
MENDKPVHNVAKSQQCTTIQATLIKAEALATSQSCTFVSLSLSLSRCDATRGFSPAFVLDTTYYALFINVTSGSHPAAQRISFDNRTNIS